MFCFILQFEKNTYYDSKAFLSLPSTQSQLGTMKNSTSERVSRCTKETFYVKTIVCSTKLTQNGNTKLQFITFLYALDQVNWKSL